MTLPASGRGYLFGLPAADFARPTGYAVQAEFKTYGPPIGPRKDPVHSRIRLPLVPIQSNGVGTLFGQPVPNSPNQRPPQLPGINLTAVRRGRTVTLVGTVEIVDALRADADEETTTTRATRFRREVAIGDTVRVRVASDKTTDTWLELTVVNAAKAVAAGAPLPTNVQGGRVVLADPPR